MGFTTSLSNYQSFIFAKFIARNNRRRLAHVHVLCKLQRAPTIRLGRRNSAAGKSRYFGRVTDCDAAPSRWQSYTLMQRGLNFFLHRRLLFPPSDVKGKFRCVQGKFKVCAFSANIWRLVDCNFTAVGG